MKKTYLILATCLYAAISCTQKSVEKKKSAEKSDNQKPNIIFIIADDLGYNDLGCYGQQIIKTPNIDTLAAQGLKFTQFYAGSAVSAPSRSVLMTGMHTGHTTIRGNFGIGGVTGIGGGEGRIPLKETDTTIAQVLQQAGYVTAMVGKWGLGEPKTSGAPYKKGFDEFYGFLNQRRAHTYYPEYIWKDTIRVELSGNINRQKIEYTHDKFAEYAIDFIKRNANNRFFLYLPFCIPHDEYEIPDFGIYKGEEWSDELKAYAAMVTRLDNTVGRILKSLQENDIDDNTYIFFTSDNGATTITGEWKMFESNAPLRGGKRDAYEGGIRVPMIVGYPNKIAPGQVNDEVWYFADVMPTLGEIAEAPVPKNIDGISVLPTILGKNQEINQRYLYWEFYERDGWRAVRFGNWKAIQNGMNNEIHQDIELYDLSKDIGEINNIADQHPEIIQKVEEMFKEAHVPSLNFMWDF
ncbi:arylsulfatase [Bacteroidota bacterium]